MFDSLHHRVHNPEGVPVREALAYSLGTWPVGVRPKVHYASARSEMRLLEGSRRIKLPSWTEHADFVVPFEFIDWMEHAAGLRSFDIMLEAKARDVALLQLRRDLIRFAPELVGRIDLNARTVVSVRSECPWISSIGHSIISCRRPTG